MKLFFYASDSEPKKKVIRRVQFLTSSLRKQQPTLNMGPQSVVHVPGKLFFAIILATNDHQIASRIHVLSFRYANNFSHRSCSHYTRIQYRELKEKQIIKL